MDNSQNNDQENKPNQPVVDFERLKELHKQPVVQSPEVIKALTDINKTLVDIKDKPEPGESQGDNSVYTDESNTPKETPPVVEAQMGDKDDEGEKKKGEGLSVGLVGVISGLVATLAAGLSTERGRKLAWGIISPFFDWVGGLLKDAWNWLKGVVSDWFKKFWEWLNDKWKIVMDWISGLWNKYIEPLVAPVREWVKSIMSKIDSFLKASSIFEEKVDPDTGEDVNWFKGLFGSGVTKAEYEKLHPGMAPPPKEPEPEPKEEPVEKESEGFKPVMAPEGMKLTDDQVKILSQYNAFLKAGIDKNSAIAMAIASVRESKISGKDLTKISDKFAASYEKSLKDNNVKESSDKDKVVTALPSKDEVLMDLTKLINSNSTNKVDDSNTRSELSKMVNSVGFLMADKKSTTATIQTDKSRLPIASTLPLNVPSVQNRSVESRESVSSNASESQRRVVSNATVTPTQMEKPNKAPVNQTVSNSDQKVVNNSESKTVIVESSQLNKSFIQK